MVRTERTLVWFPKIVGILFVTLHEGKSMRGTCMDDEKPRRCNIASCRSVQLLIISSMFCCLNGCIAGAWGCSFTLVNQCEYTVWPGILSNAGIEALSTTGFELVPGDTKVLDAPTGWSGRLWGRTGCTFDSTGNGSCATGDCGGRLECSGMGAVPPASLAEFTLGRGVEDFYDVSLVDGYNLPILVSANGGSGNCSTTGCVADLNRSCPKELQVDNDGGSVLACRSACNAFGNPEYCCSGAFGNPNTCKPSTYSRMFKNACPTAYTYAYDDSSSTCTCTAAYYTITFCPTITSEKKSNNSPAATRPTLNNDAAAWHASQAARSLGVPVIPTLFLSLCVFTWITPDNDN